MAEILEVAAKYGGLAGLALGVLLLIFRPIIAKTALSNLPRAKAYRIVLTLIICTWSIAVLGIVSWLLIELRKTDYREPGEGLSLTGQVLDADTLEAIEGAKIALSLLDGMHAAYTDSEGYYSLTLPGVESKTPSQRIRATAPGYQTYDAHVSSKSYPREIRLQRLPGESGAPPRVVPAQVSGTATFTNCNLMNEVTGTAVGPGLSVNYDNSHYRTSSGGAIRVLGPLETAPVSVRCPTGEWSSATLSLDGGGCVIEYSCE